MGVGSAGCPTLDSAGRNCPRTLRGIRSYGKSTESRCPYPALVPSNLPNNRMKSMPCAIESAQVSRVEKSSRIRGAGVRLWLGSSLSEQGTEEEEEEEEGRRRRRKRSPATVLGRGR